MTTPTTLLQWGEYLAAKAQDALKEDAPRVPGEAQCRWCKARYTCKALRDHTMQKVTKDFDFAAAQDMSLEEISECLQQEKMIVHWFKGLNEYAFEQAMNGNGVPGFKLVRKRANRRWDDEKAVIKDCEAELSPDDYLVTKLKTPPQLEKLLGKKHPIIEQHTVTPEGDLTLAPASDKRKEVTPEAEATKGF